jgi:hypothetical protein
MVRSITALLVLVLDPFAIRLTRVTFLARVLP